jgi:trehalose 6-phosphate phosphatase
MEPLALLAAEPERAGLFLDVDGVLAPVVERPEDARVPEAARGELRRLAARYALVACVTGRPSETARSIVGVPDLTYVGEHGLELEPEARRWASRVRAFARASGWPDLEQKPLAASFHYRRSADREAARVALEHVARDAVAQGFRTRWGRLVLEVLPPVDATKGTAVRRLLASSRLRRALYAGDDTTDLDGFAALDGLDLAVRVAVVSAEGPSALAARADLVLGSTEAFLELLRQL